MGAMMNKKRSPHYDLLFGAGKVETKTLWDILQEYMRKRFMIPDFQREFVAPHSFALKVIEQWSQHTLPPGCFEMFKIGYADNTTSGNHILDGVQRLKIAEDLYLHPDKYGFSPEQVEIILSNVSYPVKYLVFKDYYDALKRFHIVNSSIPLTPYQFTWGILLLCDGDTNVEGWKNFHNEIISFVNGTILRVTRKEYEVSKTSKRYIVALHVRYRQSISMFYRFLIRDKNETDYHVSNATLNLGDKYFEFDLAQRLKEIGLDGAKEKLEEFKNLINLEAATVIGAWNDLQDDKIIARAKSIHPTTARWLLEVAIYLRNNHLNNAKLWKDFVREMLSKVKTRAELIRFDNDKNDFVRMSLSVGRVNSLKLIAESIGIDLFNQEKLKKNTERLETGFHHSHIKPFSQYGNGETIPEPGLLNLQRGAKQMTMISGED